MAFNHRIAVVGLGYVGLPVALSMAKNFPGTIGYDISEKRVAELSRGVDVTAEVDEVTLKASNIVFTADKEHLVHADIFLVCVPTPIYPDKRPDLRPLESSSRTVGSVMRKGAVICYEATVYPGVTEDYCGPILAQVSGLKQGIDFKLGYSPERINPGDKEHTFERIVKVVSGEDGPTTELLAHIYGAVVAAGIHVAPSIRVAETAKVLENTQRDINIALINEVAVICDKLGIRTKDVLEAASTKWNFLRFAPGLVGGHCIGVDPYYLTSLAEELGYHPEVILAGRRLNDSMGARIAQRTIRLLVDLDRPVRGARVGIMGVTFKENVPDIRNSRVPDLMAELKQFGLAPLITDAYADPDEVAHEYGFKLDCIDALTDLDALILAVSHREYLGDTLQLIKRIRNGGVLIDVKSVIDPKMVPANIRYWSL